MARLTKWCPVCHARRPIRLEWHPGTTPGEFRWVAWCGTCNTPMPADGPVIAPGAVATWMAEQQAAAAAPEDSA